MEAKLIGIAPILLVKDLLKSVEYWENKVGFEASLFHEPPTFAILRRDGIAIMLAQSGEGKVIIPNWHVVGKTADVYIWVSDAETIYKDLIARGATIDWTLYDTPWGTREFGIQDIDDHDIGFGQVLV